MPGDNRIEVSPDELKRLISEEANAASGKADLKPTDIALIDGVDDWSASFVRSEPGLTSSHIFAALTRIQSKYRPTHFE